jgi:hypothetical protein
MKYAIIILIFIFLIKMPLQNWEGLQKSATDDETIEQAIVRLIAVHESDSESHLGANESLAAHKAADVIDHPALSVVRDKISFDRRIFDYYFNSLEGTSVTAGVELNTSGVLLMGTSGALNNTQMFAILNDDVNFYTSPMTKYPVFEISMVLPAITTQQIYVLNGSDSDWSGFGFKIVNATLYGVYVDSSNVEHTTSLGSVVANTIYRLRAEYNSDGKIYWFVNGTQVGSVTPASLADPQAFFMILVKATSAVVRYGYFASLHWDADY